MNNSDALFGLLRTAIWSACAWQSIEYWRAHHHEPYVPHPSGDPELPNASGVDPLHLPIAICCFGYGFGVLLWNLSGLILASAR